MKLDTTFRRNSMACEKLGNTNLLSGEMVQAE